MVKEKNDFNLQLDDKFRVVCEQGNFVLQKYEDIETKGTKEVRQDWKFNGYFGRSISGALKRYIQENIQQQGNTNAHQLIEAIKQAENRINDTITKNELKLYKQIEGMKT